MWGLSERYSVHCHIQQIIWHSQRNSCHPTAVKRLFKKLSCKHNCCAESLLTVLWEHHSSPSLCNLKPRLWKRSDHQWWTKHNLFLPKSKTRFLLRLKLGSYKEKPKPWAWLALLLWEFLWAPNTILPNCTAIKSKHDNEANPSLATQSLLGATLLRHSPTSDETRWAWCSCITSCPSSRHHCSHWGTISPNPKWWLASWVTLSRATLSFQWQQAHEEATCVFNLFLLLQYYILKILALFKNSTTFHANMPMPETKVSRNLNKRPRHRLAVSQRDQEKHLKITVVKTYLEEKKKIISSSLQKVQRTLHKRKTQPKVSS